jgi:osmotically-inducible protein OsmY
MTSKLVVGFGLAALCAVGASIFAVQAKRHVANDAAMSAATQPLGEPPAAAPTSAATAGDTLPPPPVADSALPATAPATTPSTGAPSAPTAAPVPTPASPAVDEPVQPIKAKKKATRTSDQSAKPPAMERSAPVIDNAAPVNGGGSLATGASASPPAIALTPSVSSTETATAAATAAPGQPTISATAPASAVAPAAGTSSADATMQQPTDSQISDSVKSEIASAAPASKVVVTTTNGAVALVGSVPSQEAIVQASQAAQRIAGVKSVDATGLFVSNP